MIANVAKFRILGATVRNTNLFPENISSYLNSGNASSEFFSAAIYKCED
jgi:hypothetical protein